MRTRFLMASSAAVSALPALAWAQTPSEAERYGYGPHMMGWGWGGGYGMFFGPLFMIIVVAAVVALVLALARSLGGPWHHGPLPLPGRAPLDILKERFARGEIDKQEYEERRRVLGE